MKNRHVSFIDKSRMFSCSLAAIPEYGDSNSRTDWNNHRWEDLKINPVVILATKVSLYISMVIRNVMW